MEGHEDTGSTISIPIASPAASDSAETVVFEGDNELAPDDNMRNDNNTESEVGFMPLISSVEGGVPFQKGQLSGDQELSTDTAAMQVCARFVSSTMVPNSPLVGQDENGNKDLHSAEIQNLHSVNPELSSCLPKWIGIFPWMRCYADDTITCSLCGDIAAKGMLKLDDKVFVVSSKKDIFLVSSRLRAHSDTWSHKVASFLTFPNVYKFMYTLLKYNLKSCKSYGHLAQICRKFAMDSKEVNQDLIQCLISVSGRALSDFLTNILLKTRYFSIVSDPCRGYLYIRCLNDSGYVRDFPLIGYIFRNNINPMDYVASLGFDMSKLVINLTGMPCGKCDKCPNFAGIDQHFPAPRPHLQLLNQKQFKNCNILKPTYMALKALAALFQRYRYYFLSIPGIENLIHIRNAISKIFILEYIINNFEHFQKKAEEIYSITFDAEALGFSRLKVNFDVAYSNILVHLPYFESVIAEKGSGKISLENLKVAKDKVDKLVHAINCGISNHLIQDPPRCGKPDCSTRKDIEKPLSCLRDFIIENMNPIYFTGIDKVYRLLLLFNIQALHKALTLGDGMADLNYILRSTRSYIKCSETILLGELRKFVAYVVEKNYTFECVTTPLRILSTSSDDLKLFPSNVYDLYCVASVFPWMYDGTTVSLYEMHIVYSEARVRFDQSYLEPLMYLLLDSPALPMSAQNIIEWYHHLQK